MRWATAPGNDASGLLASVAQTRMEQDPRCELLIVGPDSVLRSHRICYVTKGEGTRPALPSGSVDVKDRSREAARSEEGDIA